ncbi:MAG: cysteine synthase family protein [Bacteroidales bacterium]|nr:cysteine synthase family protein [Bacteroidales bacterium]
MISQITCSNILDTIGNTPLVRINKMLDKKDVNIYAKLEGFNPTGSIKDRIAKQMIEDAEREGRLTPDKIILEPTSGNTGIGLAIIGIVKGYKVQIVMSKAVSIERRKIIKSYGADIILTPATEGTDGAIRKAQELLNAHPEKYFMPNQFSNHNNYLAHYIGTACEIWTQTEGKIDYLVCSLGTSGTIMGLGKYLKEMKPDIKIVCAHPEKGHYIQGLKNMEEAIVPAIYDPAKIDEHIMIDSKVAIILAREIIKKEGIFAGMSSGAAMYAALEVAKKIDKGNIVVVFPDRAEKYLSTSMFEDIQCE